MKIKKEDYNKGYLILINQTHPYKETPINLTKYSKTFSNIDLETEALYYLKKLLKKIKAKEEIIPISGYRTEEEQRKLFNHSLHENGEVYTRKFVAFPNTSEHQTGLAIDLGKNMPNIDFICPSFPHDGICEKFRKLASDCGFIERYTEEKKDITKISKEEWHFRYISYPHSKIIQDLQFCLEEYIEYLKQFTYPFNPLKKYGFKIFFLPAHEEEIELEITQEFQISGNNEDGFIITMKEE